MIECRELRIGNYVKIKGLDKVLTVTEVGARWMSDQDGADHSYVFVEPIPLNEEWLLKFGIRELKWFCDNSYMIKKSHFKFDEFTTWEIYTRNASMDRIINFTIVKYVHQLQNLYFALTGEELKKGNDRR